MNFTHKLWAKVSTVVMPQDTEHKDKGAGFVEYGAIIVFVALVAGLIMGSGIAENIVQGINRAVRETLGT